jgi:hypothetical protein
LSAPIENLVMEKVPFKPPVNPMSGDDIDSKAVSVFYSYSHKDDKLRKQVSTALAPLKHEKLIKEWYDGDIVPGKKWEKEIYEQLELSELILLLVSQDFISSEFIRSQELKRAIIRDSTGDARVVPIIIRPTDWQSSALGSLKALPKDAKALTLWRNRDEGLLEVAKGIRKVIEDLRLRRVAAGLDEMSPAAGLALGYFVNFIHKTVKLITEKTSQGDRHANSIEIKELDGTSFCLANDPRSRPDFLLYIVLPPRIDYLRRESLDPVLERLAQAAISQSNRDRPYQYHVCKVDGQYGLIDFPSPLKVVDEWIQRRKARGTADRSPVHWRNLEAEELGLFRVVLQFWVDDLNKESDFRGRVRLICSFRKQNGFKWLKELWRAPTSVGKK